MKADLISDLLKNNSKEPTASEFKNMEKEIGQQELKSTEVFNVETVDSKEAERVLAQTEIHGDDFGGRQLTPEILKSLDLAPKYKIKIGEINIWFSQSYDLGHERIAVFASVEKAGKFVGSSYYQSKSQGLWRNLPEYLPAGDRIYWFGKGYLEESINAPILLQRALGEMKEEPKEILYKENPDFIFGGAAHELSGEEHGLVTSYHKVKGDDKKKDIVDKLKGINDTDYRKEMNALPWRPEGNFQTGNKHNKLPPEKIEFTKPEQSPDFSKSLMSWKQMSGIYGETLMEVYPSKDGTLQYLFCSDNVGRVWVGSIEVVKSDITSGGLKKEWVDAGDLTTPAYEYGQQASGYGNYKMSHGRYVDMFKNYLSKIPVIQEYLAKKDLKKE